MSSEKFNCAPEVTLSAISRTKKGEFRLSFTASICAYDLAALANLVSMQIERPEFGVEGKLIVTSQTTFVPEGRLREYFDLLHEYPDPSSLNVEDRFHWRVAAFVDELVAEIVTRQWLRLWPDKKFPDEGQFNKVAAILSPPFRRDNPPTDRPPVPSPPVYNLDGLFDNDDEPHQEYHSPPDLATSPNPFTDSVGYDIDDLFGGGDESE